MLSTDAPILVTGATGFLGGALALRLAADGVHVRALARSARKAAFLRERGIEVVYGDVTDESAMQRAVAGCGIVFHTVAGGGTYAQQEVVNVGGTRSVLDAAKAAKVKRFVHVSTVSVYGYNRRGSVTEQTAFAPGADPYAITKAAGDRLVQSSDIDYTIIRPSMIYGAGSVNWTGNLFKLARLNPTPFIGDGSGSVFPIHVDDVVDLLITAANHPGAACQSFNCAPDPSPTWREFIGRYSRLCGHDRWLKLPALPFYTLGGIALLVAPRHTMARDLPDLVSFIQRHLTYKMDKARDLIGWSPRIDLDAGIVSCIPWLRKQGLLS